MTSLGQCSSSTAVPASSLPTAFLHVHCHGNDDNIRKWLYFFPNVPCYCARIHGPATLSADMETAAKFRRREPKLTRYLDSEMGCCWIYTQDSDPHSSADQARQFIQRHNSQRTTPHLKWLAIDMDSWQDIVQIAQKGKTEALHHEYGPVLPFSGVSVPETLKERRYGRRHRNGASWLAGKAIPIQKCPFPFDGTPVMQGGR